MKEKTVYPFTAAQFKALTEEERKAVLAVAEYLTSSAIDISDEQLSEALNLMKPAEGCVPSEEADEDLLNTVRRKFAAVYQIAMELAEAECGDYRAVGAAGSWTASPGPAIPS